MDYKIKGKVAIIMAEAKDWVKHVQYHCQRGSKYCLCARNSDDLQKAKKILKYMV